MVLYRGKNLVYYCQSYIKVSPFVYFLLQNWGEKNISTPSFFSVYYYERVCIEGINFTCLDFRNVNLPTCLEKKKKKKKTEVLKGKNFFSLFKFRESLSQRSFQNFFFVFFRIFFLLLLMLWAQ